MAADHCEEVQVMSDNTVSIKIEGVDALAAALKRGNSIRLDGILLKNLTQMNNRARAAGGTPVDSGELRKSSGITKPGGGDTGEMGYTKEYAPHVEFGHRTVSGSWVPGQHFLQRNLEEQAPIFKEDLEKEIERLVE